MSLREVHPYRLRRIDLSYFKSVLEESVELGPMSVVVGANSSGKSTLLQAVLTVAQAVRNASTSAAYPLNGEFLHLGTYRESRNFRTLEQTEPMKIGIELVDDVYAMLDLEPRVQPNEQFQLPFRPARVAPPSIPIVNESDSSGHVIKLDWSVDLRESLNGSAEIEQLSLTVSVFDDGDRDRESAFTLQSGLLAGSEETELLHPEFRRRNPARSEKLVMNRAGESGCIANSKIGGTQVRFDALQLMGGVPLAIFARRPRIDQYARAWWRYWSDEHWKAELQTQRADQPGEISSSTQAVVDQAASDLRVAHQSAGNLGLASNRYIDFSGSGAVLDDETRDLITRSMVDLGESEFIAQLYEELKHESWIDEAVLVEAGVHWVGEILNAAQLTVRDVFGSAGFSEFKYLGPLRQPPQPRHARGSTATDLGMNGEFTAAVLHECVDRTVRVPLPDGQERQVKLGEALDKWLEWFGLADGASVEDHGRHGLGLKVRPEGTAHEVDLTSVGVGVSQALPVILVCLLSNSEDLLIFEQPELHLHPSLQQRMADFLLSFVQSRRQILIETHSEHMVNRLRTQVASDDTNQTGCLIKLLFAEQSDGITSYRESAINEYGGISEDWPEGFFDISAKSAQDLVRQSLRKRQRHKASS